MPRKAMPDLDRDKLSSYLESLFGTAVRIVSLSLLGEAVAVGAVKGFGYGIPVMVEYEVSGERRKAVLETTSPGPFGHEHMSDRAQMLFWDHEAYNRLPLHAHSLDVGGFARDGSLHSLGNVEEFFLLVEHVEGHGYIRDLARLQAGGKLTDLDLARATRIATAGCSRTLPSGAVEQGSSMRTGRPFLTKSEIGRAHV